MPTYDVTFTRTVEADTEAEAIERADDGKGGGHWEARLSRSHWDDDPDFPLADWQYEVANNDTRHSYRDWAEGKRSELGTRLSDHTNDLGDWCPHSGGTPHADGGCPQGCRAARPHEEDE